jgi:hypothetical protein
MKGHSTMKIKIVQLISINFLLGLHNDGFNFYFTTRIQTYEQHLPSHHYKNERNRHLRI